MESLWRLFSYRRKIRRSDIAHTPMVHLYFFPHAGFAPDSLYGACILDEYEKLHPDAQAQPYEVVITIPLLRAHALHGVAGVFLRVAS
jgi:hypothetical protein